LADAMLGVVLAAKKDYAGAEGLFRAALGKSPSDQRMLQNLGALLAEQGRVEEARRFFDEAAKAAESTPREPRP
jgi:Flp pilus assembly protein TadD